MSSFEISVGDPHLIKLDVYKLWLQGVTGEAAAKSIAMKEQERIFPLSMWTAEVVDQYHAFALLEHFLQQPKYFPGQCLFPVSTSMRETLIESYYQFDENLIRELLGKKLVSRTKKDIDEICEKIGISLRNGRRQFDNTKRIFKTVEDLDGNIYTNIQNNFLLSRKLSEYYAHITFLSSHRIECSKKKLQNLQFQDFNMFVKEMIVHWTPGGTNSQDDDLDRHLTHELRSIKFILTSDSDTLEDFKKYAHKIFIENIEDGKAKYARLAGSFVSIFRGTLSIGSGLSQSKEFRDIFIDIYERVVEPLRPAKCTSQDLDAFFSVAVDVYKLCGDSKSPLAKSYPYGRSFERFINVIRKIAVRMYG
eukprot:Nk52_evm9s242 gene=Nk52_evmTU9s242